MKSFLLSVSILMPFPAKSPASNLSIFQIDVFGACKVSIKPKSRSSGNKVWKIVERSGASLCEEE